MKHLVLIATVTAVLGAWPAASNAATFHGVVVAKQRGALLVASPAGLVRTAAGSAAIGSRVVLNGTQATVVGRSHTARIRGIVVRRVGAIMFISSNRHLVAVRTGRHLAAVSDTTPAPTVPGTPAAPVAAAPTPGTIVSTQVTIANGELDDETTEDLGRTNASNLQVQAVVSAIGTGTVTLTVGTQTLTVPLPAGLTLPASMVGQTVMLSVSLNGQNGDDNDDDSSDDNGGGSDHHGGGHDGGSDG